MTIILNLVCNSSLVKLNICCVELNDINVFYDKNSQTKSNNAKNNRMRENIIYALINQLIHDSYFEDKRWTDIKSGLQTVLHSCFLNSRKKHDMYDDMKVKLFGGRQYSFDFQVDYYRKGELILSKYLEFKYLKKKLMPKNNPLSCLAQLVDYPAHKKDIIKTNYNEHFYDKYLDQCIDCIKKNETLKNLKLNKEDYLKHVKNHESVHPFFKELKEQSKGLSSFINIVKISISNFLESMQNHDIDYDFLSEMLNAKLANKTFIIYAGNEFHLVEVPERYLELDNKYAIKNKNTIVIKSKDGTGSWNLRLRWKNTTGILLPALQIKLHFNNK